MDMMRTMERLVPVTLVDAPTDLLNRQWRTEVLHMPSLKRLALARSGKQIGLNLGKTRRMVGTCTCSTDGQVVKGGKRSEKVFQGKRIG